MSFLWTARFRKTSLAHAIANEMGADIRVTSGPAVERPGIWLLLTNLQPGDILFIDEISLPSRTVERFFIPPWRTGGRYRYRQGTWGPFSSLGLNPFTGGGHYQGGHAHSPWGPFWGHQ